MDAMQMMWEAECAQCHVKAQQTFEGFARGGWINRPEPQREQGNAWYCPGCVFGLKSVESVGFVDPKQG